MKIKIGAILAPYGVSRGLLVKTYSQAIENLRRHGLEIEAKFENLWSSEQTQAEISEELIKWFEKEADFILLLFPPEYEELFKKLVDFKKRVTVPIIPLSPQCVAIGNINPRDLKTIWEYQKHGGVENIQNLLLYSLKLAGRKFKEPLPPKEQPQWGIYHPKSKHPFESLEDYLNWYQPKEDHTIGILFPRTYWIEGSLEIMDKLIDELETKGMNVVAVFNDKFGDHSDDEAIERFFMLNGKPVVDLLLLRAYFFLKTVRQRSSSDLNPRETDILNKLNVPTMLMIHGLQTEEEWRSNPDGLSIPSQIIQITLPEFDGIAEPIIIGVTKEEIDPVTGAKVQIPVPLSEQISYVADRVKRWCRLRKKSNSEKKVALILLNSPCKSGVEASVGAGFGLDTLESTVRILKRLKQEGYRVDWVPKDGKELINRIMEKKAISEFRWTPLSEIIEKGGAAGFVDLDLYRKWLNELPEDAREKVFKSWGNPFDSKGIKDLGGLEKLSLALYNGKITIPGLINGNIFIGIQPKRGCAGARCDGSVCKILHDPEVPPPHQYIAFYKWIEHEFGADIIVHVGTHGTLELLPGKRVALSNSCYSQFLVGSLPHLYIYVVSNPMEGVIAKRRSYATLVDHLHPVMSDSGLYGGLDELDDLLEEYKRAENSKDYARMKALEEIIAERAKSCAFSKRPEEFTEFGEFVKYLHNQMTMLEETMIRDGLHILGKVPEGEQLVDMLVSVLRFDQGKVPSIRRAILEMIGLSYDEVLDKPDGFNYKLGKANRKILNLSIEVAKNIIRALLQTERPSKEEIVAIAKKEIATVFKTESFAGGEESEENLVKTIKFGLDLLPKIKKTAHEIDNLIRGFNGEFIPPGASGALTRGKVEILPTGRNFYSVDPWKIPTPAAWRVGVNLAHKFFHKYIHEHGDYPETIGFVLRFFDIFRADGELLSQILYTLGVRPIWDGARVRKLEVIPLEELNRPRIDCVIQLSNILRDGMPNAFELIDEAVQMVAVLDEPENKNFVRKHTQERLKKLVSQMSQDEANRLATFRIFTAAPGVYDYGVNTAVAASAWEEDRDLADIFIDTCGFAYGKGIFGKSAKDELIANLKRVSVIYDKWDSDEYDVLECCHIYGSGGGFTLAAKEISGKEVKVYFGDTHDPERPQIRDMKDELERIVRTKLLNPKWIEGKKKHGYKGATVISDRVYHLYGWQATTKLVEDWVFDEIAKTFVLDEVMRDWFKENNRWALESLSRRLLEAEQRKLWRAAPEVLNRLKDVYLEIESWLEEEMGDTKGDFQGSQILIQKIKRSEHKKG